MPCRNTLIYRKETF